MKNGKKECPSLAIEATLHFKFYTSELKSKMSEIVELLLITKASVGVKVSLKL